MNVGQFLSPPALLFTRFADYRIEDYTQRFFVDGIQHRGEHLETFALILDERIFLSVSSQTNPLSEMVHIIEVIFPFLIDCSQYNPANKMVSVYDLSTDPLELSRTELPEQQATQIADEIIAWRKNSVFRLDQQRTGKKTLFDSWLCRWNNRVSSAKYRPQAKN